MNPNIKRLDNILACVLCAAVLLLLLLLLYDVIDISNKNTNKTWFNVMPSENVIQMAKGEESLYRLM